MKHNIIKTENYLLVVDKSEIKEGDWLYHSIHGIRLFNEQETKNFDSKTYSDKNWKKIIAHLPLNNSPILEGVALLPPLEDEVEKLAKKQLQSIEKVVFITSTKEEEYLFCDGFEIGYNKAKEKYKYTEEDMARAWSAGRAHFGNSLTFEDFLTNYKSCKQANMPVGFKCEIELCEESCKHNWCKHRGCQNPIRGDSIVTTTNSQGLTQLLGEYQY